MYVLTYENISLFYNAQYCTTNTTHITLNTIQNNFKSFI